MPITPIIESEVDFPYKELTLGFIIAKFLFQEYINYRQYHKLGQNQSLPQELAKENVKPEEYEKSQIYSREKMGFSLLKNIITNLIDIVLLYADYFPWLWYQTATIVQNFDIDISDEYWRLSFFLWIELLRDLIISLPFSYYFQFVIEEKYGFNKTTKGLFIKDTIIGLLLKVVFFALLTSGLVYIMNEGGEYFYIYAEIGAIIFVLIAMWIIPEFIAPMFNKFTDLEEGPLRKSLFELAEKVEYPLKKIYVMDASKRSSHSNAFLYGFGSNKRIVLFDTLIQQLDHHQIEAVLCHELGHWAMWHTVQNLLFTFAQIFLIFYLLGYFIGNSQIYLSFGFYESSNFIGYFLFSLLYSPLSYIFTLISLTLSRKNEYEADRYAFKMGRGKHLQEGLKRLFKENNADMDPDPVYCIFTHSHPTLMQRIKYIRELELTHHEGNIEFKIMK